jgi:RNA polymerase sigma-70 factor, ECF subfamily
LKNIRVAISSDKFMGKSASATLEMGLVRDLTLPHLDAAYNLARWLMGNEQDAADLVHIAFLRAARYIHTYAGGNARAWWLAILRNCCLATLAARERGEVSIDQLDAAAADDLLHTDNSALEDQVHLSQCASLVIRELETLPREFREVLVLREIEDCSYREMADILSVPIGTVMSRLARARTLLRKALADKSILNDLSSDHAT